MKMFSCQIGQNQVAGKDGNKNSDESDELWKTNGRFVLFFLLMCLDTIRADFVPKVRTTHDFPKRTTKHHWQIEEEVYFSLLIFFSLFSSLLFLDAMLVNLTIYFCFDMFTWLILANWVCTFVFVWVSVFIKVFSSSVGLLFFLLDRNLFT